MNPKHLVAAFALACSVASHAQETTSAPRPSPADAAAARAQAAMVDLGQSLRAALQQKIATDGAVAAVSFCAEQAPKIAADVAARHGVSVGRTALRHRSAANAPTAWQEKVLHQFDGRARNGDDPATLVARLETNDLVRIAKGIRVEAPCLMCHGPAETIAPEVAAAIKARYPNDTATGFREGDLRGMVWAETTLTAPAPADTRAAVTMSADQQSALRSEMRRHLASVQQMLAALAANDWSAVQTAASAFGPGAGRGGAGPGHDFRQQLPEGWFTFARPMHQAMRAIGGEATGERRTEKALEQLAAATEQCVACHASFRIAVASAPDR